MRAEIGEALPEAVGVRTDKPNRCRSGPTSTRSTPECPLALRPTVPMIACQSRNLIATASAPEKRVRTEGRYRMMMAIISLEHGAMTVFGVARDRETKR